MSASPITWLLQPTLGLLAALAVGSIQAAPADLVEAEIVIFGGTSGGIAAALQAHRMGRTVAVAEWSQHLGGLTTGGLGATDIGNKGAIGGIAREFYEQIAVHYQNPSAWKWEEPQKSAALGSGQERGADPLAATTGRATKWTFEPHVAMGLYRRWLAEAGVTVHFGQRLKSVKKDGSRLVEFTTDTGRVYRGKIFIDASYEGDLMAAAGVGYHVGREANADYNENLNGVRAQTPSHQFLVPVDPFMKPGDPSSGLLPFIQSGDGGKPGNGDKRVQTYNYRLCMTRTKANLVPWETLKPPDYDENKFELLARLIEANEKAGKPLRLGALMNPIMMPNDKTDTNNNGPFSTDFIGMSYDYPEANYATRERIASDHINYIKGFVYFLATSKRVPAALHDEMNRWGLAADEFAETGNFPPQMYVREARRMISDYVMTEADCRWQRKCDDPVALGAYNMDSHNCQRLVQDGVVRNEGDVQVGVTGPYPVSYRSIVPKQSQCENLLVPVCLAATHIAYGSIRMEPVFMALGQSAATAASLALERRIPVQKVNYAALHARLVADRQILEWKAAPGERSAAGGAVLRPLPGLVVDDGDARRTGDWTESRALTWRVGSGYIHDGNANKGGATVVFKPEILKAGRYRVVLVATPSGNRASNVPVEVYVAGSRVKTLKIDEKDARTEGLYLLGEFDLPKGAESSVTISNTGTDGYVVVDGLQITAAE